MTMTTTETDAWFGDTRVSFRVRHDGSDGALSVIESLAPQGDSPPLHVHRGEDELFHVIEGTLSLRVGDELVELAPGESLLAPKGVPHTYRVDSERARWLVVTTRGEFEAFVRAVSRPAADGGLPERTGPPTAEQQARFAAVAAEHGIELVGPPLG
jgi:quercetin dioxygenase-like cupin family protein